MKKTGLLLTVIALLLGQYAHAQSAKVAGYIQAYQGLAVQEMIRTGVPAAITLAQGILESGCGESSLAKASNNHFGIKCKPEWRGDRTFHDDDHRAECFRVYPTVEASYRDHSDFLKNRPYYQDLFRLDPRDYKAWAIGLKKDGYATEKDYPASLIHIIETYHLEQYSEIALNRSADQGTERYAQNSHPDTDDATTDAGDAGASATATVKSSEIAIPVRSSAPAMRVAQTMVKPPAYPVAEFRINDTKVVYAPKGKSLLALAASQHINFHRLLAINDLDRKALLSSGQLIYMDKKPKKGRKDFHISRYGETLKDISDKEGVALKSLEGYNKIERTAQLAASQKVYLRSRAPRAPATL